MEDILAVYQRPYNPKYPLICMDEMNRQCIKEIRPSIPMSSGSPKRYDTEYERNGSVNIFILTEPLAGKRHTKLTEQRTKKDWAILIKELVNVHYPEATKITLVLDNLNTHTIGSLYNEFDPKTARRLVEKLEIHYTPKHGSWLNMAEIELSILSKQCLNRRIPDKETFEKEIKAWEKTRNNFECKINWQFSTDKARIKLKRLYPKIEAKTMQ